VIKVPVIAWGVEPPMTIPFTVPPVKVALEDSKEELAVTVPVAVIAPVVIEEGFVPISIIVAPEFSVKSLLSAVFTASSP
jgi:hypothetical protein